MKKLLYILLLSPLFFISSCEEDDVDENVVIELGAIYQGGMIFHIDQTGEHGLVAALQDLDGVYQWGCYEIEFSGADGEDIGTGLENTEAIVNQGCQTENGGITAAQAALDYEVNGYSDWYLPSKDELYRMMFHIGLIGTQGDNLGSFYNGRYWSSTDWTGLSFDYSPPKLVIRAWFINSNSNGLDQINRAVNCNVRAIRSF